MAEPEVDKKLEFRLFELLERRGRVRLGALVQLRRRSRTKGITLLQAALDAGQVEPELAGAIARDAGLPHPRARAHEQREDAENTASTEDSADSVGDAFDLGSLDLMSTDGSETASTARRPGDRSTLRQPPMARPVAPKPGGPPALPAGHSGERAIVAPPADNPSASSSGLRAIGALPARARALRTATPDEPRLGEGRPLEGRPSESRSGEVAPLPSGRRNTPALRDEGPPPRRATPVADQEGIAPRPAMAVPVSPGSPAAARSPARPPPLPALRAPDALPRRPVPVEGARRSGGLPSPRSLTDMATARIDRPPMGAVARIMGIDQLESGATQATSAILDPDEIGLTSLAPEPGDALPVSPADRARFGFAATAEIPDVVEDLGEVPGAPASGRSTLVGTVGMVGLVGTVGGRFQMGPRPTRDRGTAQALVAPASEVSARRTEGAFATAIDVPGLSAEAPMRGTAINGIDGSGQHGSGQHGSGLMGSAPDLSSGDHPGGAPANATQVHRDTVLGDAWTGDTAPPDGAAGDDDSVDLSVLNTREAADRYALGNELGRGGMGQVIEAHDLALDRPVALKLMNDPDDVALQLRFIDEARVTGQLQHPAIPPVYELGRLGDGRPFFAMKRIEGRTLRDVLEDLRAGDVDSTRTWGRVRLMNVFAQVCRAIAYAHSRSLMHRDLKPDNVMLGEFGEVTVMDWGLAKPFGAPDRPGTIATRRGETGRFSTQTGEITGTPQYMPPEQAAGEVDALGAHTDIYALGAVLYELLTLEPPFDGPSMRAVREAVINDAVVPPSLRAPKRDIPHDFEQLCLHCLRKDPSQRPRSALFIAERVETYLEGEQDRARKDAERAHWMKLGEAAAAELEGHHEAHRQLQLRAAVLRARTDPWDDGEARRTLWAAEDAERDTRLTAARVRSEGLAAFHAALGIDGDHAPAKTALADLYWAAFEAAERDHDAEAMAHAETLVRAFDEAGRHTARMVGDGALLIEGLGPSLEAVLSRIETRDRVRVPVGPLRLEGRPPRLEPLAMGSYLLEVRGPGLSGTLVPVHIGRQETLRLRLRLFPDHVVGQGFVHVAAGPARLGGDAQAALATPARVVEIDDFFLARQPVTAGAYGVFLRDLARSHGAHAAQARAPRGTPRGAPLWPLDRDGVPDMPETDTQGLRWDPDWPVVCVSAEDAEAYCAWLTEQTGQVHRLPTDEEWEKAARGADGRSFPWGEAFEASFCHMGVSRAGPPRRGPSGRFPVDSSPYGVLDLAGGVSEWTGSRLDSEARQRVVKGGHWASGPIECRAASRVAQPVDQVLPTVGFRLARDAR